MDIDYTEKIRSFQHLTDNYNEEEAFTYLEKFNWDEKKAAESFFQVTKKKKQPTRLNNENFQNHYEEQLINSNSNQRRGYSSVPQNDGHQEQEQPGFFSRYIIRPLGYIGSFFCNRREEESEVNTFDLLFKNIPGKLDTNSEFNSLTKKFIGILIIYDSGKLRDFNNIVSTLLNEENAYLRDILLENFRSYSIDNSTSEGRRVLF